MMSKKHIKVWLEMLLCILCIACIQPVNGAMQRNYIYVVDCTRSMSGYKGSPDIWLTTKNTLHESMRRKSKTAEAKLSVVPFQDRAYEPTRFVGGKIDIEGLDKCFDEYVKRVTRTNLVAAFQTALKECDPRRQNYIYFYTDGVDNVGGTDAMVAAINRWCGTQPNTKLFFVMLTRAAVSDKLKSAIDACADAEVIAPGGDIDPTAFDETIIEANTRELDAKHTLTYSEATGQPTVICRDPYFDVRPLGPIKDYRLRLAIKARTPQALKELATTHPDIDQPYIFEFKVGVKGQQVVNPTIKVVMTRLPQRSLTLNGNSSDEVEIEPAHYYPPFLFFSGSPLASSDFDLSAVFNDAARDANASARFVITGDSLDSGTRRLWRAYYNGHEVDADGGFYISSNADSSLLHLEFEPEADEGMRHFKLTCQRRTGLDVVNGSQKTYILPLRMPHRHGMHPVACTLMWIGIALAIGLVLWFALLKRFFFPTFKARRMVLTGPAPYYKTVSLAGARRVDFGPVSSKQGWLARLFTGRVVNVDSDVWTAPFSAIPGPGKRAKATVRLQTHQNYMAVPSAVIKKQTETELINCQNNAVTIVTTA